MLTWNAAHAIALSLPETEEQEHFGSPSFRVKSKIFAQLLADSFMEFGSSGKTYSKTQIIAALGVEPVKKISATGYSVHPVAHDVVLLTYRACRHSVQKAFSLRSSIWQLKDGQWRMLFHQGTPCAAAEHD